ncbi:2-oxo-4-hydroxy-4-carboxy-5-ureidoimidazoline decarboxylase [Paenibacillus alkalitolerans]|uniref:2-oxo-4-hydroxy-4-carboxy-5-ureidoimidazoline decarboxylase n=1 Tax=Paenibacillus alkalitolerans TaxID=2799335 RepID=UPI0018F288DD|nr:2-oxo-4-hydroxy-4-carboxy-5-ureidoimidazoline decarboxylase [Paenibacillus alkalitolerans]
MGEKMALDRINSLSKHEFVRTLGGIFEHSPWVAEEAFASAPFRTVDELHHTMMQEVSESSEDRVLSLFRAHPDLATRLRISELSAAEQQGAGLDRLTPAEYERFSAYNFSYTRKFGFPFIFAVRGKTKADIMEAMQRRLLCSPKEEREQALQEIGKIARFRLNDLLDQLGKDE